MESSQYDEKKVRKAKKLPVALTKSEYEALVSKAKSPKHKLAFYLAFNSGLRISEVIKLEHRDIDMVESKIFIREGKGKKDRIAPLPKGFQKKYLDYIPIGIGARAIEKAFRRCAEKSGLLERKPSAHYHCVSDDTEILTKEGWKNMNQIKKGEKVFSFDINKNIIEEDKIKRINIFDYDDEMVNIKNTYCDSLMSMEHKDLMNISHIKVINGKRISSAWDGWKLISMNDFLDMPNKRLIKKKVSGKYCGGNISIGKAKAGLLGWILTDGCISKRPNKNYDITISQSYSTNKKKCKIINKHFLESGIEFSAKLQKLKKSGFNTDSRMLVFRFLSKNNNLNWIFDFINEDKSPKMNILNLKYEELEEVFNGLMLGDGCYNGEFASQKKKLVEFLQILCVLLDRRCLLSTGKHNQTGKTKLRTWVSNRNDFNILPSHISRINYKGKIWCPTTKNNTWIARRNGKVFITGNSLRHGFATYFLEQGGNIQLLKVLMGHTNIATTDIYNQLNPKVALDSYKELF